MYESTATTPEAYLAELPDDRRATLATVRDVILAHLPAGYVETIAWGMITYEVPLATYADTYNGKPLSYVSLAAMKRHLAIYLMGVYQTPALLERLVTGFRDAGLKLDMGKACLRFKTLDDLPLAVIGDVVGAVPVAAFVAQAKAVRES